MNIAFILGNFNFMPAQSTILVKKKDGTSVRMTMDEFKVYVRNTKATKVRTVDDVVDKPDKIQNTSDKIQNPTHDSRNTTLVKQWTEEDHMSPLEVGEVKEARKQEVVNTVLPENRGDAYDAVMRNLKFSVADELRSRLKSLIVSRVKDIRTDEQVVEYATRAVANGGLGLTESQAGELVVAIGIKTLKHENIKTSETVASVRTPKADNRTPEKYPISNISRQSTGSRISSGQYQSSRPIMHDIIAPAAAKEETKASAGPIEELQQMTLVDFRRLSANPAQASEILLEKFENLKEESYVLFIKAVQAWYNSPLYRQYQQIIADAVNQSVKVNQTFGQMKNEEWMALVKLSEKL